MKTTNVTKTRERNLIDTIKLLEKFFYEENEDRVYSKVIDILQNYSAVDTLIKKDNETW